MPTGPCVLWMDTRGAEHNLTLLTDESFMLFVERHGLIPLPSGNDNVAHIHVLRTFHPDAYAAAAAFVEPMDYVNARLTGRVGATQSHGVRAAGVRQPHLGSDGVRPGPGRGDAASTPTSWRRCCR